MSWYKAVDFANQVTLRHNAVKGETLELCYTCTDSNTTDVVCEESMNPYQCTGYRLPTYAGGNTWRMAIRTLPFGPLTDWFSSGWLFPQSIRRSERLYQYSLGL